MLNKKFFFALVGLFIAVLAILKSNCGLTVTENWWGQGSKKWKVIREVRDPSSGQRALGPGGSGCGDQAAHALQSNLQGHLGNDQFIKTANMQSHLAPRFSNLDYGALIRYNAPAYQNQAVPCNPLTFGEMVNEGYASNQSIEGYCTGCGSQGCSSGCSAKCGKGGVQSFNAMMPADEGVPPGYAACNYNEELSKVYGDSVEGAMSSMLPVAQMTTVNAAGDVTQPIVYDRYVFANRNSRLRSQGDPIRGDLPIVPCKQGWFNVYPNVNIDLQEGAMNVMGGINNDTAQALSSLIYEASGNAETNIGGVALSSLNFATQYGGSTSAAQRDIQITAYP